MPKTKTTSRVKEMIVPDWMNKEIKSEAMTEEELRELEKEMEMFK